MPRVSSPNPDFDAISVPGEAAYSHPVDIRAEGSRPIPMAFQVTSPFNRRTVLLPHALVLHVNPSSLQETHNQKIERFQTRGGFVEQHWGHELVDISADASTGVFMNIRTGLTSVLRQRTIAWDRFRDLHDLFRNNGSLHDPLGNVVLQGNILLMYDRGSYYGGFRSFEWEETADSPFAFKVSWSFKVEQTIMQIDTQQYAQAPAAPAFQRLNTQPTANNAAAQEQNTGVENALAASTPGSTSFPNDTGAPPSQGSP